MMLVIATDTESNTAWPAAERRIRVLCVDDQPVVRRSLAVLVSAYDDMEMVGEADSGEEAVRLCQAVAPHVILMDIMMPGMGGVAATHAIRKRWPYIRVIGLTSFVEPSLLCEMLRAGASLCLTKSASSDDLVDAIRAAYYATLDTPE